MSIEQNPSDPGELGRVHGFKGMPLLEALEEYFQLYTGGVKKYAWAATPDGRIEYAIGWAYGVFDNWKFIDGESRVEFRLGEVSIHFLGATSPEVSWFMESAIELGSEPEVIVSHPGYESSYGEIDG